MALRPVVFSGPSGTGKSTLLNLLFKEFPSAFGFSVSHTTRKPRPGEEDGKHYHFTTLEQMQTEIKQGKFIEHAQFSGNMYGTSIMAVEDVLKQKKICLLDIDEQGVKSIKKTNINPLYIFVAPPSLEALRERLKSRGTESEETIEKRMATAVSAMKYSEEKDAYDVIIINDILERAYKQLRDFLMEQFPDLTTEPETASDHCDQKQQSETEFEDLTINNNGSITEISLSPVKLKTSSLDDAPAVMNVDSGTDMDDAAVVTSENLNSDIVVTTRSSVIDMETENTEKSAACGDVMWNSCAII
uniref:guanylate kinase n=1 Tax=Phallusia mammillata TaxID=59560 RepID=A0A6F9DE79_9ASCI|nr:estradiol 17-beta-dehydrogenase 11 [Phallusia mammillata]